MQRIATAVWTGGPRAGEGRVTTASGLVKDVPYAFSYSAPEAPSTSPCELLAASHASCVSQSVAAEFSRAGYHPTTVETHAIHTMSHDEQGWNVSFAHLELEVCVPDAEESVVRRLARHIADTCALSRLLKASIPVTIEVHVKVEAPKHMAVA